MRMEYRITERGMETVRVDIPAELAIDSL
jgi:uncharacterized protein YjhX (UPF0386 family)